MFYGYRDPADYVDLTDGLGYLGAATLYLDTGSTGSGTTSTTRPHQGIIFSRPVRPQPPVFTPSGSTVQVPTPSQISAAQLAMIQAAEKERREQMNRAQLAMLKKYGMSMKVQSATIKDSRPEQVTLPDKKSGVTITFDRSQVEAGQAKVAEALNEASKLQAELARLQEQKRREAFSSVGEEEIDSPLDARIRDTKQKLQQVQTQTVAIKQLPFVQLPLVSTTPYSSGSVRPLEDVRPLKPEVALEESVAPVQVVWEKKNVPSSLDFSGPKVASAEPKGLLDLVREGWQKGMQQRPAKKIEVEPVPNAVTGNIPVSARVDLPMAANADETIAKKYIEGVRTGRKFLEQAESFIQTPDIFERDTISSSADRPEDLNSVDSRQYYKMDRFMKKAQLAALASKTGILESVLKSKQSSFLEGFGLKQDDKKLIENTTSNLLGEVSESIGIKSGFWENPNIKPADKFEMGKRLIAEKRKASSDIEPYIKNLLDRVTMIAANNRMHKEMSSIYGERYAGDVSIFSPATLVDEGIMQQRFVNGLKLMVEGKNLIHLKDKYQKTVSSINYFRDQLKRAPSEEDVQEIESELEPLLKLQRQQIKEINRLEKRVPMEYRREIQGATKF